MLTFSANPGENKTAYVLQSYNGSTGYTSSAQVRFNPQATDLDGERMVNPTGPGDYAEAVRGIFVHEVMHTLGLDHISFDDSEFGGSVMNPITATNNSNGLMATSPGVCDTIRLDEIYPNIVPQYEEVYNHPYYPHCWSTWVVVYEATCTGSSCTSWVEVDRVLIEIFCN